jgi:hypothetical protein
MQEALIAWAVWGVVAIGVWETYARFPAAELYNVTRTGLAGGAARTLVFLNWPVAIAAVALVIVAADRLLAGPIPGWRRVATVLASAAAIALCATIALPGVLDQDRLDARTVNLPAAAGVLLALLVTLAAVRVRGTGARAPLTRGDRLAIAAVPILVIIAVPRGSWRASASTRATFRSSTTSTSRRPSCPSRANPSCAPSTWETTRASTASSWPERRSRSAVPCGECGRPQCVRSSAPTWR